MMGDDSDGDGIGEINSNSTAVSVSAGEHDALALLGQAVLLGGRR